ncbi:MAG TPA: nitrite/sulfite reductase [Acidimicrobiales bacterium]|nr:nitrite/sulfite reductase [Acidimicrobiales bacterium]
MDGTATVDLPTDSETASFDRELFDEMVNRHFDGSIADDRFRIFRLNYGVYGQRQGGDLQMVRVKLPAGAVTAEQLDLLGAIAIDYSRGWGHITTRQNIQFHFIELNRTGQLLSDLAESGLTTREACGDTVRNITACPLAGACPSEVIDVTAWAKAAFVYFLNHPYGQRLPRKFKINFSGCALDCGQAMFNDVGVVATTRTGDDGLSESGFRVFIAGGLGANPHPAQALEDFTSREDLLATLEATLRTFDHYGNRENKIRSRMKWLVDTLGIDELRRRIIKERDYLIASSTYPGGIPDIVTVQGDARSGSNAASTPGTPWDGLLSGRSVGVGNRPVPVSIGTSDPFSKWRANAVIAGKPDGSLSVIAHVPMGDITGKQFSGLASIVRRFGVQVRVTNRQNFVLRDIEECDLRSIYESLEELGFAKPGAELARDVVSCPGADTCNLAVTQSRGLAESIGTALDDAGLSEVGGIRINISGCTNSCGQHHVADIGFSGAERRAHGRSAPGYQMYLGGHLGDCQAVFASKAIRLPAKRAPEATVYVVGRFDEERLPGEPFHQWLKRSGGAGEVAKSLAHLDDFPPPEQSPELYVDYLEIGPFSAEVGEGECAGT